jgi:hypothetical protein
VTFDEPGAPRKAEVAEGSRLTVADAQEPPDLQLSYRLVGVGSAEARLTIGDSTTGSLRPTYLTDALGDLLRAVEALSHGQARATVRWALEPGECRWLFESEAGFVNLCVLVFDDDYFDNPAEDAGREILSEQVRLDALVAALAAGARVVLEEHGAGGYRELWAEHPFPVSTLRALERQ